MGFVLELVLTYYPYTLKVDGEHNECAVEKAARRGATFAKNAAKLFEHGCKEHDRMGMLHLLLQRQHIDDYTVRLLLPII